MRRLAIAAVTLILAACASGDAAAPRAGSLALNLAAGGASAGAVVVTVSGGPVTAVSAPGGFQVASNADASGTHIIIAGNIAAGTLATIEVPDVARSGAYIVTVDQVADRDSFALLDPTLYQVAVGAPR